MGTMDQKNVLLVKPDGICYHSQIIYTAPIINTGVTFLLKLLSGCTSK